MYENWKKLLSGLLFYIRLLDIFKNREARAENRDRFHLQTTKIHLTTLLCVQSSSLIFYNIESLNAELFRQETMISEDF